MRGYGHTKHRENGAYTLREITTHLINASAGLNSNYADARRPRYARRLCVCNLGFRNQSVDLSDKFSNLSVPELLVGVGPVRAPNGQHGMWLRHTRHRIGMFRVASGAALQCRFDSLQIQAVQSLHICSCEGLVEPSAQIRNHNPSGMQ